MGGDTCNRYLLADFLCKGTGILIVLHDFFFVFRVFSIVNVILVAFDRQGKQYMKSLYVITNKEYILDKQRRISFFVWNSKYFMSRPHVGMCFYIEKFMMLCKY